VDIDETNSSMGHEEVFFTSSASPLPPKSIPTCVCKYGLATLAEFDGKELTFDVSTRYHAMSGPLLV
jgi:hypothetical protein